MDNTPKRGKPSDSNPAPRRPPQSPQEPGQPVPQAPVGSVVPDFISQVIFCFFLTSNFQEKGPHVVPTATYFFKPI